MLVVGEEGWPLERDGRASQKLMKVTQWRLQGAEIKILKESDWLRLLELEQRGRDVHRLYTPAMLSQLLDVPAHVIRGWERAGLIKPVRKVYRLPYFDFQEVSSARRIVALLESGVPRSEIEAGLSRLQEVLEGVDRPLAQLAILGQDSRMLIRDELGLVHAATRQRLLDFEPPASDNGEVSVICSSLDIAEADGSDDRVHWNADEWFREGCRLLHHGEARSAVEAFRLGLMEKPGDAEINFYLAESLYRVGNSQGALERYYAAVEADHTFLESWTQLGCLHAEQGELQTALDAFGVALDVHPDYPEAHWHTADVMQQMGRTEEAAEHWAAYLKFDSRGPWAEQAGQRLDEIRGQSPVDD